MLQAIECTIAAVGLAALALRILARCACLLLMSLLLLLLLLLDLFVGDLCAAWLPVCCGCSLLSLTPALTEATVFATYTP